MRTRGVISLPPRPAPIAQELQSKESNPAPQSRRDSPPPCGEGLGVGGLPPSDVLQSPPPCPSPTRGEGTLRHTPRSIRASRSTLGSRAKLHETALLDHRLAVERDGAVAHRQ